MILVDSSVWIDYFRGAATAECDLLDRLLGSERLLTGDLILVEVLQGFRSQIAFRRALDLLGTLEFLPLAVAKLLSPRRGITELFVVRE